MPEHFDFCLDSCDCGGTKEGEMQRTAEMMIEIAERNKENPKRAAADMLSILRAANRTTEKDLLHYQEILDAKLKKSLREIQ